MNNITVDGSYFNNSFGLGNQPGDRTNVAPISMDAIEQVQVNVAPFDVRSGNFVGAGVNTVTRSGTNNFRGSGFYQCRNQGLVGTEAKDAPVNPGTFSFTNYGGWGAGPIVKNRLFFFGNAEKEETEQPGTTFRANRGGETVGRQRHPRARLGSRSAELVSAAALQLRHRSLPGLRAPHSRPSHARQVRSQPQQPQQVELPLQPARLGHRRAAVELHRRWASATAAPACSASTTRPRTTRFSRTASRSIAELNTVIGNTMSNSLIVGYNNSGREPLDARRQLLPVRRHPQRRARSTRRSATSRSRPTTSCATRNSSCRTTSPASRRSTR